MSETTPRALSVLPCLDPIIICGLVTVIVVTLNKGTREGLGLPEVTGLALGQTGLQSQLSAQSPTFLTGI